jgi:hypothetical protein
MRRLWSIQSDAGLQGYLRVPDSQGSAMGGSTGGRSAPHERGPRCTSTEETPCHTYAVSTTLASLSLTLM